MIYASSRWKEGKKSGAEVGGDGGGTQRERTRANESERESESTRFFETTQQPGLCWQDFAIR